MSATTAEIKDTNPKQAIGSNKIPLHLWPSSATVMGSLAFLDGALKYGKHNWREGGAKATIYIDAAMRHLLAYFEGEEVDPDSGVPHLGHALACIAIIVDAKAHGVLEDDRAYFKNSETYRTYLTSMTPLVAALRERHADKNPKHYTIKDVVV